MNFNNKTVLPIVKQLKLRRTDKTWKLRSYIPTFLVLSVIVFFVACDRRTDVVEVKSADSNKPTTITTFSPDSGGIATPMIIVGENFGTDTTKLDVFFINELLDDKGGTTGVFDTVPGSIVSSNGSRIYLMTPKLTYKDKLKILVRTETENGEVREIESEKMFKYKTETTVTTVAGTYFANVKTAVTQGGTLSTASFSCPMFICVDSSKNVLVVERVFNKARWPDLIDADLQPKKATGDKMSGSFLLLNEADNRVDFMQQSKLINAPTISPSGNSIYVPTDAGADYYVLNAEENYSPRLKTLRPTGEVSKVIKNNYKFSFVTRKSDGNIFTIMYKGQLLMINPRTSKIDVLCDGFNFGEGPEGDGGTDLYLMFDPKNEKTLYASSAGSHTIFKIMMVEKTDEKGEIIYDKYGNTQDTVSIKPWAGGMAEGLASGASKGWADAGLKKARFKYPRQLTFDENGVMYIADSGNHCIRTIDTKLSDDVATVKTLVGIPGDPGNVDGGPDLARFRFPFGIAVAFDGTIYIADTRNYSIRKLAIQ